MAGILDINNDSRKIIAKYLKKEYKNSNIIDSSYIGLQNSIIDIFKNEKKSQLHEMKLNIEMDLLHLNLYNLDNFVNTRYAFYALVLAVIAIIFSNPELLNSFIISKDKFITLIIFFLIIVLVSSRKVSDIQKEKIIYLNFKLRCIEIIFNEKK